MTNAQKWVTAVLVIFILLLVLSKMTKREDSETEYEDTYAPEKVETDAKPSSGIYVGDLLANNRCFTCHGNDLNGTGMGPSLANVGDNWNKADLVSYFKNPKAFFNNPRMAKLKGNFKTDMPAQEKMTQEELEALAEHLLTRK
jgi:mono/diheme cytochrome c family protein